MYSVTFTEEEHHRRTVTVNDFLVLTLVVSHMRDTRDNIVTI